MKITRDRNKRTIHLSQEKILKEALETLNLQDCNPSKHPYDTNSYYIRHVMMIYY